MARSKPQVLWRDTPAGNTAYIAERAKAQALANEHGYDIGIECNELFKTWRSFALPMRHNRCGFELTCEVVMPENLAKCQPGHGPPRKLVVAIRVDGAPAPVWTSQPMPDIEAWAVACNKRQEIYRQGSTHKVELLLAD